MNSHASSKMAVMMTTTLKHNKNMMSGTTCTMMGSTNATTTTATTKSFLRSFSYLFTNNNNSTGTISNENIDTDGSFIQKYQPLYGQHPQLLVQQKRSLTSLILPFENYHQTCTSVSSASSSFADITTTTTTITTTSNKNKNTVSDVTNILFDVFSSWIWHIKRTYQPSILRRKRKFGYLKRRQTPGGRKILRRRKAKGRQRLFGA